VSFHVAPALAPNPCPQKLRFARETDEILEGTWFVAKPQTSNPNMHRRTDRELPIVVLIARHGQVVQGFGSGARQVSQRLPLHQGNVHLRSFILLLQSILSLLIPLPLALHYLQIPGWQ
jgi:hypothetical protein